MELDQVAAPAGRNLERYLLLTIRTPDKVPPEEAAPGGKKRAPLNFAAVLDTSGSMQGEKIAQAREAVRQAVRCLHAGDGFSLVTFSNEVHCPFEPMEVDEHTGGAVVSALQGIDAGGMTALAGGLEKGIENASKDKKDTNLVLVLSDGQANVGETDLEKIGQRAWQARGQGLLVSALGVGIDYNEALMTEIATQGGGRFYHVEHASRIPAFVAGELGEAAALAARDVKFQLDLPKGVTLLPLSAVYPVEQNGEHATVSVGDIPCDTELEIPLRLAILAQPAGAKLGLTGTMTFRSPAGNNIAVPVNRVTVRILESGAFQLREGMIPPVAERVFTQIKAASVLNISRLRAVRPGEAEKKAESVVASLHAYADLLGEGRAEKEMLEIRETFASFDNSPAAAKQVVAEAHRSVRATKDFNQ